MRLIILLQLVLLPKLLLPCGCIGQESIKSAIKRANVVFVGKMIKEETFVFDSIGPRLKFSDNKVSFLVKYIYKGKIKSDTIKVITGIGGGDCGFPFIKDKEYIIYANYQNTLFNGGPILQPFLYTDVCTHTAELTGDIIAEMKKYKIHSPRRNK